MPQPRRRRHKGPGVVPGRVDGDGSAHVQFCLGVELGAEEDGSKAIPGVVVTRVLPQRVAEARLCLADTVEESAKREKGRKRKKKNKTTTDRYK